MMRILFVILVIVFLVGCEDTEYIATVRVPSEPCDTVFVAAEPETLWCDSSNPFDACPPGIVDTVWVHLPDECCDELPPGIAKKCGCGEQEPPGQQGR